MTIMEAAKKIGISTSKLYQLVAARHIAHYRVSGKIVFCEDDITSFLASCRVPTVTRSVAPPSPKLRLKHLSLS